MEVQQKQLAIVLEAKRHTKTTIQAIELQHKRTLLLGKILALHNIQDTYMPDLTHWPSQQNLPIPAGDQSKPETIKIFLPSSIPATARDIVCLPHMANNEEDL
ncbi:hypothetical protein B0H14DRAFT_3695175 [Mycena olivaceomarginata]|nr:hypothetical protein B0H14DRAFT_3695175 [Mycena olivaceomarginata]